MKTQEATTTATKQSAKKPKASKAKATKATKAAKSPRQAANSEARAGSKKEIVLKLLRRDQGAILAEIAKKPRPWAELQHPGNFSARR